MPSDKQTAAALAAVAAYMQQEEAARLAAPRLIPADTYNQLYLLYTQLHAIFGAR